MPRSTPFLWAGFSLAALSIAGLAGCGSSSDGNAAPTATAVTVGVAPVTRQTLTHTLDISSELVPFQQIDVYAKESGFVQKLDVDYGSRVQAGQVIAVLEIPELQAQLEQDQARIKSETDDVTRVGQEVSRYQAMDTAIHLEYQRLNQVMTSQPGLVAQQEVDDAQSKDLAAASQVDASQAQLAAAQGDLAMAQAQLAHDQALYNYSRITAPFAGVVTQRYANLGTLVQGGTNSSTQALPLVQLSEDDVFRLVIPVPESDVRFIHVGDPVSVNVPSMNATLPGRVARTSDEVTDNTRTLHTEVDVDNPKRILMPGLFAEANLTLEKRVNVVTVPLLAISHAGPTPTVFVVNSENQLQERPVTLGMQTADSAEILSGVQPGDEVVVSDRSALKPGETVKAQVVPVLTATPASQN